MAIAPCVRLGPYEIVAALFPAESSVQFASGHLLFLRDSTLMAQAFDPSSRHAKGEPFPIAERLGTEGSRYVTFSASPSGLLAYGHGDAGQGQELTWYDRSGATLGKVGDIAIQSTMALSPDERRAAIAITTGSPPNRDVWVVDLARAVNSRVTSNPGDDSFPVWSPDGARIAFQSAQGPDLGIRVALPSGERNESLLKVVPPALAARPTDWSSDGRFIAFTQGGIGGADVWVLPLAGDRTPFSVAHTSFIEDGGVFSPDGKWLAFSSNESGQFQVYVQPFPPTGAKHQVSRSGGAQPVWRSDGRELFFLMPDATMMAASIDTMPEFAAGLPQRLFASRTPGTVQAGRQYGVTRDGKRFLMVTQRQTPNTTPLTVVVDWLAAVH